MGFEIDLDFTGQDLDQLEAGTVSTPGWYRCVVADVADEVNEKNSWNIHYRVTDGPYTNGVIYDRLYDPTMAEDAAKGETSKKRLGIIAKRLGIWDGKDPKPRINLVDAVGKECWIRIVERTFKAKDGTMQKATNVGFADVYPLTDERVPIEIRNPGAAPATSAKAARKAPVTASASAANGKAYTPPPVPPARPKPDYSDL
jgi:hypothetical protein